MVLTSLPLFVLNSRLTWTFAYSFQLRYGSFVGIGLKPLKGFLSDGKKEAW